MTIGDDQQFYNLSGAIGTFCLLPGVWDRLDVPDLTIMSAPGASLVVSGRRDDLFLPESQAEAARQIRAGCEWAGCADRFGDYRPDRPHCYDAEVQAEALEWFGRHLGGVDWRARGCARPARPSDSFGAETDEVAPQGLPVECPSEQA